MHLLKMRGSLYPIYQKRIYWDLSDIRGFYSKAYNMMKMNRELILRHKEISINAVMLVDYPICQARGCSASCLGKPIRKLCSEHGSLLNPINELYHAIRLRIFEMMSKVKLMRKGENARRRIIHSVQVLHGLSAMEISLRNLLGRHYPSIDYEHNKQINQCYIYYRFFDFLLSEDGSEYIDKPWGLLHHRTEHRHIDNLVKRWCKCINQEDMNTEIRLYFIQWGSFSSDQNSDDSNEDSFSRN